jgi:hypothetical protein
MDLVRHVQSNTVGSDSSLDFLRPISNCVVLIFFSWVAFFWLVFALNYVVFPHHCHG